MMRTLEDALGSRSYSRILIREDFNVPMKAGQIMHTARIDAALPTLKKALATGAPVIILSHLGRPKEGHYEDAYSLRPIAHYLKERLSLQAVPLFALGDPVPSLKAGEMAILENVRFLKGEANNDPILSKQLAALGELFVMDAFAVAHRTAASTCGIAQYASAAVAGPLLQKELAVLSRLLIHPKRPLLAILGGSKMSTKFTLLEAMLDKIECVAVGGGIANTFLAAEGHVMGDSLYERDQIPMARFLLKKAKEKGNVLWYPEDVVTTKGDKIVDIGPRSQKKLSEMIRQAKTILWNGPVGLFEHPDFSKGTEAVIKAIKESDAFSVAGGGDTLAAIDYFHAEAVFSYLSTGGGAFLESLEGKTLPAVAALEARVHV